MLAEKFIQELDKNRNSYLNNQKEQLLSFVKFIIKNSSYIIDCSYNEPFDDVDVYNPFIKISIYNSDVSSGIILKIICYNHKTQLQSNYLEVIDDTFGFTILDDDELLDKISSDQKAGLNPVKFQPKNENMSDVIFHTIKHLKLERKFKIHNILNLEDDE